MKAPRVVPQQEWLTKQREHLTREKELTRLRDQVSRERRSLPWVKLEKQYRFLGPEGHVTLGDLFGGRSQLVVYHFMYGADWDEGCPSCSFWADSFDRSIVHLNHRDISMVVLSRAPLEKLLAYKDRMGWSFTWLSSFETDFNADFQVSCSPKELEAGDALYNFQAGGAWGEEMPGLSVFARDEAGVIYHTYSAYARGLDKINVAYQIMDLVPKGRDENDLPYGMAWLRRRDAYED